MTPATITSGSNSGAGEYEAAITALNLADQTLQTESALKSTIASPTFTGTATFGGAITQTPTVLEYTTIATIDSTKIVGTTAGDIGHADGAILVAAPGAGYTLEFVSAVLIYDYATAAFAGGADDAVIQVGVTGAQVASSSAITGASLLEASADKMLRLGCIATELVPADNSIISLYGTALTNDGGTAAGLLRVHVTYRRHTTGL